MNPILTEIFSIKFAVGHRRSTSIVENNCGFRKKGKIGASVIDKLFTDIPVS